MVKGEGGKKRNKLQESVARALKLYSVHTSAEEGGRVCIIEANLNVNGLTCK